MDSVGDKARFTVRVSR